MTYVLLALALANFAIGYLIPGAVGLFNFFACAVCAYGAGRNA